MADERLMASRNVPNDAPKVERDQGPEQGSSDQEEPADTMANQIQTTRMESSVKAQDFLNHILQFLSTASNGTLGACLAGLGATTYFLLGRVGLVLIGTVGGVVLHAMWEENVLYPGDRVGSAEVGSRRRREDELDILRRALDWRMKRQGNASDNSEVVDNVEDKVYARKSLDFSQFEPATGAALTGLTDAVIRDYVKWWYGPLLPDDLSFPDACRQTFTGFALSLSSHLSRKRPEDVFLNFLTNSSSIVIVFLNELANALTASAFAGLEATDALHQYLEQNPSSNLANVLDIDQQRRKLQSISQDVLQSFLDPKAYNCEPVRVFLRQILAGVCLEMTIQTCSKPEWINGWVVYLLEGGEPELLNVIDAGVGGAAATKSDNPSTSTVEKGHESVGAADESATSKGVSHRRTVSKAEEAMDEAMQEAKRLSDMIAAEEAKKSSEDPLSSGTTTGGDLTPTSSQSDLGALANGSTPSLSDSASQEPQAQQTASPEPASSFTNFDQLFSSQPPTALQQGFARTQSVIPPLTLQNASISIFDDSMPGEKNMIRSKPTIDYLLQVEPATSQHPGWMIARKYADFETLHEVLKRISVVSGVPEFADRHPAIPGWKNQSKDALRADLERYLRDALSFNRLAESEGMKRFLEKDQGIGRSSPSVKAGGFGFPTPAAFESMGKGMLDVLSAAPKGAAGGGKAILGGVTNVLGGVGSLGQKKQASLANNQSAHSSNTNLTRVDSNKSWTSDDPIRRISQDLPRTSLGSGSIGSDNSLPKQVHLLHTITISRNRQGGRAPSPAPTQRDSR
ncbi:MAG: hypothetical protein Q9201_006155 [Fulgogasparrea decipioides]